MSLQEESEQTVNRKRKYAREEEEGVDILGPRDGEAEEDDDSDDDDDGDNISNRDDDDGLLLPADDDNDKDRNFYDDDEEPEAEGDEHVIEEIEPSEENFGKIKFYQICKCLESITKQKKPVPLPKKLKFLLPPKSIQKLKEVGPGSPPQTPFPLIRLLCPDKDASRDYFVKHKTLARAYVKAYAWDEKTNPMAQALINFHDPNKIAAAGLGTTPGDLSEVLKCVLEDRLDSAGSSLTLADVNKALDELAAFRHRGNLRPANRDWEAGSPKRKKAANKEKDTVKALQADWVRRLLHGGDRRLSPVEHKWLARIALKEMKFSIGFDKILCWFDPVAPDLWSGHNSLRGLCRIISQPSFHGKAVGASGGDSSEDGVQTLASYLKKSSAQVQLGVPFTPMFSDRTSFQTTLFDLSLKHRKHLENPLFGKLEERTTLKTIPSLIMKHPAFSVETKLDGERMMIHLSRDGLVKIHTRQSNWYSDLYSPVLGPAIREAFGHHRLDMIIDGEILAWDDEKEETIPFGNNKTVANFRADWMKYQGLLDTRDRNLHKGENEVKVIHSNMIWGSQDGKVPDLNGRDCWLQFIAFDIVYMEGDGAKALLDKAISPFLRAEPGSLMDLELFERKKLLYHVIKTVPRFVEVVPTLVVSSDGETYRGSSYFSLDEPPTFAGRPLHSLDSVATFLHEISTRAGAAVRKNFEENRYQGSTDEDISRKRALAVGDHYRLTVDDQRQEGLLFKDLSTPYVLDKVSRSLGYWRKFKPDYDNGSTASDLDVVIIGAYFASGLRNSGRPSSFLCACTNEAEDEEKYMPLCKVNAGSIPLEKSRQILDKTGFQTAKDDEPVHLGKWFVHDEHGKSCPDFVSSYDFSSDTPTTSGWKPRKQDYPDIWIDPDHSMVLTLNAGEIVPSTAFPARVTLRFPRITNLRPEKKAREVESLQSLWDIHDRVLSDRAADTSENAFELGSSSFSDADALKQRFWTEEKFLSEGRRRKHLKKKTFHSVAPDGPIVLESAVFRGVTVVSLEGTYCLLEDSLEAAEGQEEGWFEEAKRIKDHESFRSLIKRNGGTTMLQPTAKLIEDGALIVGGDKNDPRVINFIEMLDSARAQAPQLTMKKKRTDKDNSTLIYSKCKGVVRWTFFLSVLTSWRASTGNQNNDSIKETKPEALKPDSFDYLARPKGKSDSVFEDLCRIDVRDLTKMRRLLQEVKDSCATDTENDDLEPLTDGWRSLCKDSLAPTDRWVAKCAHQLLWSYQEDAVIVQATCIYPHVFDNPLDVSNQLSNVNSFEHSAVLSVLPLVRGSGAFVATKLHYGVTHVLCQLRDDLRKLPYAKATPNDFKEPNDGKRIIVALQNSSLYPDNCPDFVSPAWARHDVWDSSLAGEE